MAFLLTGIMPPRGGLAQEIADLPAPGSRVMSSAAYTPPLILGMKVYPDQPLQFDFIIDTGDDNLQDEALAAESQRMIHYFLAALTVPEDELWVNLSPYEQDRIVADGLGATEMGRDMLAQDYLLKQLTASLMYPEAEIGSEFWQRIYAQAQARLGTTDIPTNTFNKIWIVPERAVVYVNDQHVFVSESHLKVLLEEDYLSRASHSGAGPNGLGGAAPDDLEVLSSETKQVIREVLIPEIEREVNQGRTFANLRQIYHAMILAAWYKKNLRSGLLGQVYADRNKIQGIDLAGKDSKDEIYNRYVAAFEKGVYDYIKEDYDPVRQAVTPRRYFAGGVKGIRGEDVYAQGAGLSSPVAARQTARYARGQYLQRQTLRLVMTDAVGAEVSVSSPMAADPDRLPGPSSTDKFGVEDQQSKLSRLQGALQAMDFSSEGMRKISEGRAVIADIAVNYGINVAELEQTRQERAEKRGGFDQGLMLDSRDGPDGRETLVGKLVRDKILDIMRGNGQKFIWHVATVEEHRRELLVKRFEEFAEVKDAVASGERKEILTELADLSEVLNAIEKKVGEVGGIDFNARMLDLVEQGQSIRLHDARTPAISPDQIYGIQPVMINTVPILDFMPLLGLSSEHEPEHLKLSRLIRAEPRE